MKRIKKIAEAFGIFSPIVILLFACASYLSTPENNFPDDQVSKEVSKKRMDESSNRESVPQSLLLDNLLCLSKSIY